MMLLGVIADDFTGASDVANTLAKGGMATVQFAGIPVGQAPATCEAGVVALKTRSIPAAEAVAQSLDALAWLKAQGCRQFLFKYCSTFDSTSHGNIGPVTDALLDALDTRATILCPAFPATGRRVFMGHLFVGDHLLSESGMERHPINPMTDSDIRRWLRHQTRYPVGFVTLDAVRLGPVAITAVLDAEIASGRRLVVVDAVADIDLSAIGLAVAGHALVTGAAGIAQGLPANFRQVGLIGSHGTQFTPTRGPAVVLSGSCSSASLAQVDSYLKDHPGLAVDPFALAAGRQSVESAAAFVLEHLDRAPIVYSTTDPAKVEEAQASLGQKAAAEQIESFFGHLAAVLAERGIKRIAVGGGETSGAVIGAIGVKSLSIGPEIDPGVPAVAIEDDRGIRLALKSGNFGASNFFEKALVTLGEG